MNAELVLLVLDPDACWAGTVATTLSESYDVLVGARAGLESRDATTATGQVTGRAGDGVVLVGGPNCASPDVVSSIEWVQRHYPGVPSLLVTPAAEATRISEWLSCGLSDFVTGPVHAGELLARVGRLLANRKQPDITGIKRRLGLGQMIGASGAFRELLHRLDVLAGSSATVLIEGETGTGKEVCARAIHYLSTRSSGPFVAVNCGAIPAELMENELFGHERDAYTGATTARSGLVGQADGGTLLLDEIDSLPLAVQVKLLRLLQSCEYRPLGAGKLRIDDVRIVAATNADLHEAVRTGRLRQDFFYRLDVLHLQIPPLRERPDDILPLAHHFVAKYAAKYQLPSPAIPRDVVQALLHHPWPGNVRELENAMERAVLEAAGRSVLVLTDMRLPGAADRSIRSFQAAKAEAVARFERDYIERLLAASEGNISDAARTAGKHRRAFWELMRKHQIDARRYRRELLV